MVHECMYVATYIHGCCCAHEIIPDPASHVRHRGFHKDIRFNRCPMVSSISVVSPCPISKPSRGFHMQANANRCRAARRRRSRQVGASEVVDSVTIAPSCFSHDNCLPMDNGVSIRGLAFFVESWIPMWEHPSVEGCATTG